MATPAEHKAFAEKACERAGRLACELLRGLSPEQCQQLIRLTTAVCVAARQSEAAQAGPEHEHAVVIEHRYGLIEAPSPPSSTGAV